jgi:predicted Fe-Mo cluster-binding NifX family protein
MYYDYYTKALEKEAMVKLAIATNDKRTIPKGHFGESRYFCVVDIEEPGPFTEECRDNPLPAHDTPGKSSVILDLLGDCDVLIGRGFGRHFFSHARGAKQQAVLTPVSVIDDVVQAFSQGELKGFRRFDPERGKFLPLEEMLD